MSQKLYGARISVSGAYTAAFNTWYSTNKSEAAQKIQSAQKTAPPLGCKTEVVAVESDIILKEPGTYELEDGSRIFLSQFSGIDAHGCMLHKNGKLDHSRPVHFLINGESRTKLSKVARKVFNIEQKKA